MNQTPAATAPTVTAVLDEKSDDQIVLRVPGTDYRLHLVPQGTLGAQPGDRVTGTIRMQARKVLVAPSGGRYVEPVFGRPRRVQGRILGGDLDSDSLYVHCGLPILAALSKPQKARDFAAGQLVNFDVLPPCATFEQA